MNLILTQLPRDTGGIYTIGGSANRMPERALYLHPDAARAFAPLYRAGFRFSDLFRSPESSLEAVKRGRGALPPGYSAHNYGLAFDLDVTHGMKLLGVKRKADLDAYMAAAGWFCHRRDGKREHEEWHYNYLGVGTVISGKVRTTAGYVEAAIVKLYGSELVTDDRTMQGQLKKLGLYGGALDGLLGPLSRQAINAFQRAWRLKEGKADDRTRRTLALVSATRSVIGFFDTRSPWYTPPPV